MLAGRSASRIGVKVEGNVKVAGQEINPVAFRRNIAYVMQDDALMVMRYLLLLLQFHSSLYKNKLLHY